MTALTSVHLIKLPVFAISVVSLSFSWVSVTSVISLKMWLQCFCLMPTTIVSGEIISSLLRCDEMIDWLIDWFYTVTSVCWVTDRRKRVGQHKKDFNSKFKFKREKSNIKSLSEWAMNQIVSQLPRSRRWGEVPSLSGHRTLLMLSWRTVTGADYHQFCRVLVINLVNVSPQSWLFLLRGT